MPGVQAWLRSPARKALLEEARPFIEEFHARTVRSGFEHWFPDEVSVAGEGGPSLWKMNMLVLLMLYPIVFLWSIWIGTPLLSDVLHMSFATSLFVGNIVSVVLTGFLVPWVARRFGWWLRPDSARAALRTDLLGAAIIAALYVALVAVFYRFS